MKSPNWLEQPAGSEQSEQECVDVLLNNFPEGRFKVTMERIIRAAFRAGWLTAANPAIRPENDPLGKIQ
jgi:hypothetical protein